MPLIGLLMASVNVKVEVVMVEASIAALNVATMVVPKSTRDSLLTGYVELTVGGFGVAVTVIEVHAPTSDGS